MLLILTAVRAVEPVGLRWRWLLSGKVLFPIAQISYSLYLVHEMIMLWLFPKTAQLLGITLGPHGTMATAAATAMVMSFAMAALLYLFVEQPSMRARELAAVQRFHGAKAQPSTLSSLAP